MKSIVILFVTILTPVFCFSQIKVKCMSDTELKEEKKALTETSDFNNLILVQNEIRDREANKELVAIYEKQIKKLIENNDLETANTLNKAVDSINGIRTQREKLCSGYQEAFEEGNIELAKKILDTIERESMVEVNLPKEIDTPYKSTDTISTKNSIIDSVRKEIVNELKQILKDTSDGKVIAEITLSDKAILYSDVKAQRKSGDLQGQDTLKIIKSDIVFQSGYIKSIKLYLEGDDGKIHVYSNQYSIGITTRNNINKLTNSFLRNELEKDEGNIIRLSQILIYDRKIQLYTQDFSPKDDTIVLKPGKTRKLTKPPRNKLFRANIFTDFVGFENENPNGIIQVELSKRINFFTTRKRLFQSTGIGFFTHLTPFFEFSKLEDKRRNLEFSNFTSLSDTQNFISNLQIFRYNIARTGIGFNIMEIEGGAVDVMINPFLAISMAKLKDSILEEGSMVGINKSINSMQVGSSIVFQYSPYTDWAFNTSVNFFRTYNFYEDYPFQTIKNKELISSGKWIMRLEMLVTLRGNDDNRFFARYRFNNDLKNWNENFYELQFGYSIFIKGKLK